MARAEDIEAPMTLEIDGSTVSPEKFVRAVTAFFEVVRELCPTNDAHQSYGWHVQVKKGSNLIGAYPSKDIPAPIVDHVLSMMNEGVSQVENEAREPQSFTDKALKSLRKLGQVAGTSPSDDTRIIVWVGSNRQRITHRSVDNVTQILEASYEEEGSVAGKLQTISERGGLRFVVYEELWDRQVRCNIPDRLVDAALHAFRKRVEVYGPVRYQRDGIPVSVFVRDIEEMPDRTELPDFEDVRGILRSAD